MEKLNVEKDRADPLMDKEEALRGLSARSRFFVLKSSVEGFERAVLQNLWATPLHQSPPHPHEILSDAFQSGFPVVLIISVTATRRYQGVAIMKSCPAALDASGAMKVDSKISSKQFSAPFDIEWLFRVEDAMQEGLHFSKTNHLQNSFAASSCINLSRNCQEVDQETSRKLCEMIHAEIQAQRRDQSQRAARDLKISSSFFSLNPDEERSMMQQSKSTFWEIFLAQVREKIGQVVLATVIGSRRYGVQIPESDLDLFVVAVSPVPRFLAFPPHPSTFKNPESTRPDFTIYGIEYFIQLLKGGDTKVFECLFLAPSTIHFAEMPYWGSLVKNRKLFITKQVFKNYLSEIRGIKGLKQISKLREIPEEAGNSRFYKKWYIILRCLIHAQKLLRVGENFCTYFEDGDESRQYLMDIREGKFSHEALLAESHRRLEEIERDLNDSSFPDEITPLASEFLQDWYMQARIHFDPSRTPHLSHLIQFGRTSLNKAYLLVKLDLKPPIHATQAENVLATIPFPPGVSINGDLLLVADYTSPASTKKFYFGIFQQPLTALFNLDAQSHRSNLSVSNARGPKGASTECDYQFYELESMIDAIRRSDLFAIINIFLRTTNNNNTTLLFKNTEAIDSLLVLFPEMITSSLMLAASGWLSNNVARLMRGKRPEALFEDGVVDATTYKDVLHTLSLCIDRAIAQADEAVDLEKFSRARTLIASARDAAAQRDAVEALRLVSLADTELEPLKPFTAHLPTEVNTAALQRWSCQIRQSQLR